MQMSFIDTPKITCYSHEVCLVEGQVEVSQLGRRADSTCT